MNPAKSLYCPMVKAQALDGQVTDPAGGERQCTWWRIGKCNDCAEDHPGAEDVQDLLEEDQEE